jgi:hypothetical protein
VIPKPVQGFRQARRAQFRGSTGGFYQLCQFYHGALVVGWLVYFKYTLGTRLLMPQKIS